MESTVSLWEELVDFGFDVKDARFYLEVLEAGRLSVADAAERAYVSRTNGYDVAKRLAHLGLVQFVEVEETGRGPRRVTMLEACNPDVLLTEVEQRRRHLETLVPRLQAIRAKGELPRVRYLEGSTGISAALFETLAWESPIRGILSMQDLIEAPGREAMRDYIAGRREHGLWLKVIRAEEKEGDLNWPSSEEDLRELRLAPPGHAYPFTILFGERAVVTLSSRRENFAMIVEDPEYARLQRDLFESMWQISTPG